MKLLAKIIIIIIIIINFTRKLGIRMNPMKYEIQTLKFFESLAKGLHKSVNLMLPMQDISWMKPILAEDWIYKVDSEEYINKTSLHNYCIN